MVDLDSDTAVYEQLGATLENVVANRTRAALLRRADAIVRLSLTAPEATFTIDARAAAGPTVTTGHSELHAEMVLQMEAELARSLFAGELSAMTALADGRIALRGPVAKLLGVLESLVDAANVEPDRPAEDEPVTPDEPVTSDAPAAPEEPATPDEPVTLDEPEAGSEAGTETESEGDAQSS